VPFHAMFVESQIKIAEVAMTKRNSERVISHVTPDASNKVVLEIDRCIGNILAIVNQQHKLFLRKITPQFIRTNYKL